jgi:hypothetical protein
MPVPVNCDQDFHSGEGSVTVQAFPLTMHRVTFRLRRPNWGQPVDFMALQCHDQTSAPFVTWKLLGSLLESTMQTRLAARHSACNVHLISKVHE